MKKLLSALCGGVIGIGAVSASVLTVAGCGSEGGCHDKVCRALDKFTTDKPLRLDYIKDEIKASDPNATKALRSALVKQDKSGAITKEIADKITFGDQEIKVDQTVPVGAIYAGKTVPIAVHENKKSTVEQALQQFTTDKPLRLDYIKDEIKASDPNATKALRSALVEQDKTKTITTDIATKITFGNEEIKVDQTVPVSATYQGEKVSIGVHENKKQDPVVQALQQFTTDKPLRLDYIKDEIKASDPNATKALRSALVEQDKTKTITTDIATKITFGNEEIKVDQTVPVSATYQGEKVSIGVHENNPVVQALQQFTNNNPLQLDYIKDEIKASDPNATKALRSALVEQDPTKTITTDIAAKITFGDDEIKVDQIVPVGATYQGEKVSIGVHENKKHSAVLDFLKKKFPEGDPLLIFVDTTKPTYADEVANIIRDAILYYAHSSLINRKVVNGISFDHQEIQTETSFPLVIKYKGLECTIYALNTF